MIRIGCYDAFDKWAILCRYWQDPSSVPDPCAGRNGAPVLLQWDEAARVGGGEAVREYIQLKAAAPEAPGDFADAGRLQQLAAQLVAAILAHGYDVPFDGPPLIARLREVFKAGALQRLRWTMDADEIPSIGELRAQARIFPTAAIRHKRKVLCLFCALFLGRSDVIHVYDAAPDAVTLIDNDPPRLEEMKLIYPKDWRFILSYYQNFIEEVNTDAETYDLIVCDQPEPLARMVAWDNLKTIMTLLCSDMFIANYWDSMFDELGVTKHDLNAVSSAVSERAGIGVVFTEILHRGPNVHWVVMRKTA